VFNNKLVVPITSIILLVDWDWKHVRCFENLTHNSIGPNEGEVSLFTVLIYVCFHSQRFHLETHHKYSSLGR